MRHALLLAADQAIRLGSHPGRQRISVTPVIYSV